MSDKDDKLIKGHEYDGIQELDNPLPGWWLLTFYGAIIYAIFYVGYYWFLGGPSHDEQLAKAMTKINAVRAEEAKEEASKVITEEDYAVVLGDEVLMTAGKGHYDSKCLPCHGAQGEGLVGPNLTDKYWLHSKGDKEGILLAIQKGFPDKGMPPWKEVIPAKEQLALTLYVSNMKEVKGKEPQGELIE